MSERMLLTRCEHRLALFTMIRFQPCILVVFKINFFLKKKQGPDFYKTRFQTMPLLDDCACRVL